MKRAFQLLFFWLCGVRTQVLIRSSNRLAGLTPSLCKKPESNSEATSHDDGIRRRTPSSLPKQLTGCTPERLGPIKNGNRKIWIRSQTDLEPTLVHNSEFLLL